MNEILKFVMDASKRVGFLSAEEEKELIVKVREGDKKTLDKLFCANARYIYKEARKYARSYGLSLEDSFSAACEGFVKGITHFDLSKGTRLITIAGWWIQHAEQDELFLSHMIKIPHNKLNGTDKNLDGFTQARIQAAKCIGSMDCLLDEEDEKTGTLHDIVASSYAGPEDETVSADRRRILENVMAENLSGKERLVLEMLYGFDDGEEKSLSEVGKVLNCSKQRVAQVRDGALMKLRHPRVSRKLRDLAA